MILIGSGRLAARLWVVLSASMNDKLKSMVHSNNRNHSFCGIAHHQRMQMDALLKAGMRWSWSGRDSTEALFFSTIGLLAEPPSFAAPEWESTVTVVIPTHRAAPVGLEAFLEDPAVREVLILANGSFSPTLKTHPKVRVQLCSWQGHGLTRQSALSLVTTPFVLFSVDDAIPIGRGAISRLVSRMNDGGWDAIVGRQIPWPSAPLYLHRRLMNWMPAGAGVIPFSQADHVATLYRVETLSNAPIPSVPIAEDLYWSQEKRIGLCQDSLFLHSHLPSVRALWKRETQIEAVRCQLNCHRPVMLRKLVQHSLGASLRRDWASLIYEGTEALAQWYAQQRFSLRQPSA